MGGRVHWGSSGTTQRIRAEVFMGDVGSLALGGRVGTIAVIIKQEVAVALYRWLCRG